MALLRRLFLGREEEPPSPMELLRAEVRECEFLMRRNEVLFNMETDEKRVDAVIYEREALRSRYAWLTAQARALESKGDGPAQAPAAKGAPKREEAYAAGEAL